MQRYNPSEIESKWQQIWDDTQVYRADLDSDKPKYIAMSMFNYPSGAGIHIGHAMNYTISDVMARFKRQQGYESYHPVGWDSFGLPAENFAIKTGVSPQASMAKIIPSYHTQYKAMGWSNDWSKEITTSDPEYYKWTQWIFAEMFRAGLAYQEPRMQWWCAKCQTVLANEQVIDGKCWRHDAADDPEVAKKEVKQWFFKVTEYADEMLEATDALDWSEVVKSAQKNWIGKSQGAEIEFAITNSMNKEKRMKNEGKTFRITNSEAVTVFTTRPDTIFGATFLVLAPEHELVAKVVTDDARDVVENYVKQALKKSELERQETKEKTGVPTGAHAINPATGEKIPIWVADYVLSGYGTGAIMAVPAHDERDFEFAEKFKLPIVQVVAEYEEIRDGSYRSIQDDAKNLDRGVIDAIIRNDKNQYLVLKTDLEGFFVGGGIEPEDKSIEDAIRREIVEETGYTNVISINQATPIVAAKAYKPKKERNEKTWGAFYEVVVDGSVQIKNESDEGKHEILWVDEGEVEKYVTVKHHVEAWRKYLSKEQKQYVAEGVVVNSGVFDGMPTSEAREEIVAWLEEQGIGKSKTTYKIRDWSVSRQRYWGAPIPIVHCPKDGAVLVPDDQLPVVLPELDDFQPSGDGRSALARATDWLHTTCPKCGGPAERETDTLDTYICSSWYFLRYFDPQNFDKAFEPRVANKWMPIDFYNGGDHATAHMIYARFMTRFFWHQGLLENPEPFKKFLFNGKVTASDGTMFSKSKGNGVDPLEIINQGYGADALRTYLMFAAPLEQWMRWDPQGVPGTYRFLSRIWNLVQEFVESDKNAESNDDVLRIIHPTIRKVTADLEEQKYNTAIAAMMEATNKLYMLKKSGFDVKNWQFVLESLVALVAPFAPHLADELWHDLGRDTSVQRDSWPRWDKKYLTGDTLTIVVQVNGKVRAKLEIAKDTSEDDIKSAALADENVQKFVGSQKPAKVIYVPGRLVNIVV